VRALDAGIARLGPLVTCVQPAIEMEMELGHFDAALRRVEPMLEGAVRKERWHSAKGEILERAGRRPEAAEAYRAAVAALERVPIERRSVAAAVEFERKLQAALERVTAAADPQH
jgi:predicted RNA polymerase sigma factor